MQEVIGKQSYRKLVMSATVMSLVTALIVIISKIVGFYMTDSITLLASLADSFLDLVASFLNVLAARYAIKPPDDEHRFGHGKAEDIAVYTQSALFGVSGFYIAFEAIKRFSHPIAIENINIGFTVMVISVIATSILIIFQRFVVKRTNSKIVAADSLHYTVDLLSNIAIIISFIISAKWGIEWIDPLFAIGIALYILMGAWNLISKAFKNLMDHEFDHEDKERLAKIVRNHPDVRGMHDLKTRISGPKAFIQLHLEMDGNISLYKAHDISVEIEKLIHKAFPNAEIIIHQDPDDIEEKVQYKAE